MFNIVGELKAKARARGEDIIDFGMGNPDQPTPQHIVDKMVEAAQRGDTHRYSVSKGIPRLRRAICNWYKKRFDVDLNMDSEAIVTIGSKEGLAHLALATMGPGDVALVPNPLIRSTLTVSSSPAPIFATCRWFPAWISAMNWKRPSGPAGPNPRCWC